MGVGLEEIFMFESESENRDRAVEAVEPGSTVRVGSELWWPTGYRLCTTPSCAAPKLRVNCTGLL